MKSSPHGARLVAHLQRLNGWRLWLLLSVGCVAAAVSIVSLMSLALQGRVTADYVLTGLVTASLVAPAALMLLNVLLQQMAAQQQQSLLQSVQSAETLFRVALDSSDEGVLVAATDGRVLAANKRFLELWRVPEALSHTRQEKLLLAHVLDQLQDPDAFVAAVQRLYGSQEQANDTLHFKDGRVFDRYTRALDLGGQPGRIWCFRDVSVQAQTRQALAEREELYRAIVNQAGEGIDLIDAQSRCFIEVNEAACRMLGYRREELVGQPQALVLAAGPKAGLPDGTAPEVQEGTASLETRYRCKDGRVLEVLVSTRAIGLRGRACLVGTWHDIGERKSAQEALEQSRNLLQAIIDAAPLRVFWKDQHLRYLGCNPAFARDAGKSSPEELLGLDDFAMAWAEQAERYRADDRMVMESGVPRLAFDEPQTTPDGRTMWLRTSKVVLRDSRQQAVGLLGVYEDVTESKLAEVALREREEIFSAIVNHSVEGILLVDAQSMHFVEFNDAACEGLGYSREEFARLRLCDVQATLSESQTQQKCLLAAASPEGFRFENQHRCKDGSRRDRHVSNRMVQVGGRTCLAVVWHDVTESKRLADALQAREQYQRALLDNFPFMVWLKDEQSRFLAVNAAFARVFGWPSAEALIGKCDLDIAPPDLAERYRADDQAVLQSGHSKQVEELVHTGGRRTWFETYKSPVALDGKILGTVGFGRDITERKQAEWNLQMAVEVTQLVFWKIDLLTQALSFDHANLLSLGLGEGLAPTTLQGWMEHVHADDAAAFEERLRAALQPDGPLFDLEYRMRRQDGHVLWMHTKGSVIQRGAQGQPELAVGTSMNISGRKLAEQAVRDSEARSRNLASLLRLMADNVPDMIWAKDLDKRFLFANRALCRHLLNATDTDEPVGKT
ncbi:MAG: PAS domain S-box protein, partial [Rubrivivax sp.]|nr:PAS domain S-box protein [Rubrivivax sp.]